MEPEIRELVVVERIEGALVFAMDLGHDDAVDDLADQCDLAAGLILDGASFRMRWARAMSCFF